MSTCKVVHYLNQFYGGIGGEDKAGCGISVKEGAVGPGILIPAMIPGSEVVATIICGDNYFAENLEPVSGEILDIVRSCKPDLFIAGPGFNAGRYGLACGAMTAKVQETLEIPAVTALFDENPGTDLYKNRCYILKSDNNAKKLKETMARVTAFAKRLADGGAIGGAEAEGYHGTGPAPVIDYKTPAAKRGLDMLLSKWSSHPFKTEVVLPKREPIAIPYLNKPIQEAKLAVVTDGGLVPKGNPDKMVPVNSTTYRAYAFESKSTLAAADYEVSHQGYNNAFVQQDPNRLVPLDALRRLCEKKAFRALLEKYYTTAGVMTPMEVARRFGQDIAAELKAEQIDAVLLVST